MKTPRTTLKRRPGRGAHDAETIHAILDEALVCHVGFAVDGQPYVIPTFHARLGGALYLHGAAANRMLGVIDGGAPCCVTATLLDGLVLARSAFHHSMNYRSVVVLGSAVAVTNLDEKRAALDALVEKVMRGRGAACRPPSRTELETTSLLRLAIDEASAKLRSGPPIDDEDDHALPHWAGEVPLRLVPQAPVADPRLASETPFPHDLGRDAPAAAGGRRREG